MVAIALELFAGAGGLGWFGWFPQYRPSLRQGEAYGVDVSHHQKGVDWQRVVDDGISFAYIKATEGGDHVDRQFRTNWDGARRAGLTRGAYHFFTLCAPGAMQAKHFIDMAPPDPDALPPAVDLELAGNCSDRPSPVLVARELEDFLHLVETASGQRAVLYIGDDFERRYPTRASLDRPLWHRRILRRPAGIDWVVWQFTGWGQVDGISGPVDINVMRTAG